MDHIADRRPLFMQGYSQHGFVLSLGLHLTVAAAVAVLTFFHPFRRAQPTIFEVVKIPRGDPNLLNTPDRTVDFDLPPAPVQPEPRPTPPAPQPTPPRPATPPPAASPRPATVTKPVPTPAPAPPREQISYQEFIAEHGKPQPRAPRPAAAAPVRNVPRLDTRFSATLSQPTGRAGSRTGSTDAERTAQTLYLAAFKDALLRSWNKPAGLAETTSAEVDFDIAPNGRVGNARITRSSRNAAFDESVLAAFRAVGSAGPTPDGREMLLNLSFNMNEE
jgi:TonB family protein